MDTDRAIKLYGRVTAQTVRPKGGIVDALLLLILAAFGWWIFKKVSSDITAPSTNAPSTKRGTLIRFEACLTEGGSTELYEAQQIAMTFEEPYRTNLLKRAWSIGKSSSYLSNSSERYRWLRSLPKEVRERVAPGEHYQNGVETIRYHIADSRGNLDWKLVDECQYELTTAELEKMAKKGDLRAIQILNKSA